MTPRIKPAERDRLHVDRGIPRDCYLIHIVDRDAGLREALLDRKCWEHAAALPPIESLLRNCRDDLTILDKCSRANQHVVGDAENPHAGAVIPRAWASPGLTRTKRRQGEP